MRILKHDLIMLFVSSEFSSPTSKRPCLSGWYVSNTHRLTIRGTIGNTISSNFVATVFTEHYWATQILSIWVVCKYIIHSSSIDNISWENLQRWSLGKMIDYFFYVENMLIYFIDRSYEYLIEQVCDLGKPFRFSWIPTNIFLIKYY